MSLTDAPTDTDPPPIIVHVAICGGPCGGKSSALAALTAYAASRGYEVTVVPEAATAIATLGFPPATYGGTRPHVGAVLDFQLTHHAMATALASTRTAPQLVLHDRGALDGAAYSTPEIFAEVVADRDLTRDDLVALYAGVLHLTTAAKGTPHAYGNATNAHRHETAQEAADLDDVTLAAWAGSNNHIVIDNYDDFADKLAATLDALATILDLANPSPTPPTDPSAV